MYFKKRQNNLHISIVRFKKRKKIPNFVFLNLYPLPCCFLVSVLSLFVCCIFVLLYDIFMLFTHMFVVYMLRGSKEKKKYEEETTNKKEKKKHYIFFFTFACF